MSKLLRIQDVLAQGQTAFGTFMMLPSTRTAQVVASTGLDAVIIDCEHGNIDDASMHQAVFATAACGASPVVRVRGIDPTLIKRALDAGAHALMVPMINTASEAQTVVRNAKFPPTGVRGQGSPFTAFSFGCTTPEYLKLANKSVLTMVQIETTQAVQNADEIAAVEGVDILFIGPNDLAFSLLGYTPASTETEFKNAIERVVQAARSHGKKVGILVSDGNQAAEARKTFDFVAIGGDVKCLTGWFQTQLADANASS